VAWELVRRGSPAAGVDGVTVDLFAGVAQWQIQLLMQQLRRSRYDASPARGFYLQKKSGGHRLIGIPTVRDRIVQRFLLQAIYPKLEQVFGPSAFAYRPGLSIYTAVDRVMERYRHQPAWVVKADIEAFFDRLVWPLLLNQLEQLQLPELYQQTIAQQLKSGIVLGGRFQRPTQGVLQGGVLSGALANLYLHDFDRQCLDADIHLVRYGDDCVAVCQSLIEASRSLRLMQDWVENLYLNFNPEKTRIIPPGERFTFLGHEFCNGEVIPPKRNYTPKASKRRQPRSGFGPPKLCSIVKSQKQKTSFSTDEYWSDDMTTLYISDQGAFLCVNQQEFQVFHEKELKCSIPISRVSHIVLFGCCNFSSGAMSIALRRRIPILYATTKGRHWGQLSTEGFSNTNYLTAQVLRSQEPGFGQRQAKSIILGKLHNSRMLLLRLNRRRPTEIATKAITEMAELMPKVEQAENIESMLGYEGHGATLYFRAFATLLLKPFAFEKRSRRPPTDPVNSLLSFGYTLLFQNLHAMVSVVGLHESFGNLHTIQKNRPSLVCDLVEEFRAYVVDSLVAYLVNSKILTPEDFTPPNEHGGVYLFPDARQKFHKHWNDKLQTKVTHPHTGNKVSYRRCMELQVWEYLSCVTGERETYRPMRWDN
jgi:CRISPR-associated endonuclease Cas1/group II intron reverse transcriptase/maturase